MSLQAVPNPSEHPSQADIPKFGGKQVKQTSMVVKGVTALECDDRVLNIDQIVRLTVEARVTGVHFKVDDKTGALIREQTVRAIDVEFTPWVEGQDDGVLNG